MIYDHRSPHAHSRWRRTALLSALVTSLSLASGPALAAPAPGGGPEVPALRWVDCGDGFSCSRASVPLDYTRPDGAHISLALIRLPATDQTQRIGSLLTNFGGPGTEGIDRVRTGARALPAAVRARFDVIGVDPRGVGASSPIRCFPDVAAQEQFLSDVPLFPRFPFGHRQQAAYITAMDRFGDVCLRRNAAIMRHMSTVNVARDLDLLRRALGDDSLTF
jgi:pimeloyl-ACP methyl ester carboxylesterase